MIEFAWPWSFLLLPIPFLVWKFFPASHSGQMAMRVPSLSRYRAETQSASHAGRAPLLLFLCWALLITGIARPEWVGDPRPLPTAGRDLLLAVDISGSMGDDDMLLQSRRMSRIELVKLVLKEFIERREGDRIGLILFGTRPYVQAPLTFDRKTVATLLEEAPLGIAGGRTAIGDAIGLSVKRLLDRPADSRVLVLLTDGANNTGELFPTRAAEIAKDADIRIHTIGFSGPGTDFLGRIRSLGTTELDEQSLREVAETTGGEYFRATAGEELEQVYRAIDQLEPTEQDPDTVRPVISYAYIPIGLAWCLGCLLLIARKLKRSIA